MKNLIFFIIMMLSINLVQSQVTQKWVKNRPGLGNDVAIDGAGNIYVCGKSLDYYSDFITIKYNSDGYVVWERLVSGIDSAGNFEAAHALAVDSYGNVYVTGTIWNSAKNKYDYLTVKYNSAGFELWRKLYGFVDAGNDYAHAIEIDNSGNVFVTGLSHGIGHDYDYATIKYGPDGTQLWVQRYDGPVHEDDAAYSLSVDGSGNVVVTGKSNGADPGFDFATVKYWSGGDLAWVRRYNNSDIDIFSGAVEIGTDANGSVYVTGSSEGTGTDKLDITTIKYSPMGVTNWVRRYDRPGSSTEMAKGLKVDAAGNVYVTGYTHLGDELFDELFDIVTIKYSSSGVQKWARIYNSPENIIDIPHSLAIDALGNVYVTGSKGTGGEVYDFLTLKYSSSGLRKWVKTYNGPANYQDIAYSIAVRDSIVVVTGNSKRFDLRFDMATIKYRQTFVHLAIAQKLTLVAAEVNNLVNWGDLTQGNGNALKVKLNAALQKVNQGNKNAAINELSAFVNQTEAFVRTNKLIPEYGESLIAEADDIILELSRGFSLQNGEPSTYTLRQNYPNPFNPATTISFNIPKTGFVSLKVYDVLGNEAAILVNENLNANSYEVSWDASGFASGVYFYKITADGFTETRKMVLIK